MTFNWHTASCIDRCVERSFETAPDRHRQIRENPVTGIEFTSGLDPIGLEKKTARRVLAAVWWFEQCRPGDAPRLPVNQRERESTKSNGLMGWLVAEFAA